MLHIKQLFINKDNKIMLIYIVLIKVDLNDMQNFESILNNFLKNILQLMINDIEQLYIYHITRFN